MLSVQVTKNFATCSQVDRQLNVHLRTIKIENLIIVNYRMLLIINCTTTTCCRCHLNARISIDGTRISTPGFERTVTFAAAARTFNYFDSFFCWESSLLFLKLVVVVLTSGAHRVPRYSRPV